MTNLQRRIIKRAIKNRMSAGESFEDIIKSYPKLTESEIAEIKAEFGIDKVEEVEESEVEESEVEETESEV